MLDFGFDFDLLVLILGASNIGYLLGFEVSLLALSLASYPETTLGLLFKFCVLSPLCISPAAIGACGDLLYYLLLAAAPESIRGFLLTLIEYSLPNAG